MPELFFNKFPTVEYANSTVKDISKRVGLSKPLEDMPTVFYAYDVPAGQRADLTAYGYYGDSYFDWLIYLTNGIIDPIYDWYLSERDFDSFMTDKYGTIENAKRRVKYWQNDWASDDNEISVSFYTEVLPEASKKYYTAIFGEGATVTGYVRRQEDWTADTNQIKQFTVTNAAAYLNLEIAFVWKDGQQQGKVEIRDIYPANNTLEVWHVEGNNGTNAYFLAGFDSGANQSIVNTNFVANVIPLEEGAFWSPVSIYDWEVQKNESKKSLHLLEASFAMQAAEQLRLSLQNTISTGAGI